MIKQLQSKRIFLKRGGILSLTILLGIGAAGTGCSSTLAKRSQNSDGLVGFLFDNSPDSGVPVEAISGNGGVIRTAHLKIYGEKAYVTGFVTRQGSYDPPPWAHVDVLVFDKNGKEVQGFAVRYIPSDIPHGYRGQFPQSKYTVRLAMVPQSGSKVKVVFHNAHKSECQYGSQA